MKYILVTGGVISGIGKGVIASSIGAILKGVGFRVTSIKIDPYINIDAGTFSPYEHGEVFVLDDGGEVDLDLGNYERFLDVTLHKDNNITTGKIYQQVINHEREGQYLGKTVQVIPHITDAIMNWVERVARRPVDPEGLEPEICIIELGGTIGDIEGMPFVEAFRQFQFRVGRGNFCCAHVSLVPQPSSTGEQKTKPTQASVRELRGLGLYADLIVCRSEKPIGAEVKLKLSNFCHVAPHQVICLHDVKSLYRVPVMLTEERCLDVLQECLHLRLPAGVRPRRCMAGWRDLAERATHVRRTVTIALVGKYTSLQDSYASVIKALQHAALLASRQLDLQFVQSEHLEEACKLSDPVRYHEAWRHLCRADGLLVPGGFGHRGVEGKVMAIQWARVNAKPFLGVCLGMQAAVIEYARHVAGLPDAQSTEFVKDATTPLIIDMPEHNPGQMGGTMRLGRRATTFRGQPSVLQQLYGGATRVDERHRHRYEVNPRYVPLLEQHGLHFVGQAEDKEATRMEIVELPKHPYFVGVQFHPEYLTRPTRPSPPYLGLVLAACGKLTSYLSKGRRLSPRYRRESTGDTSSDEELAELGQAVAGCMAPLTEASGKTPEVARDAAATAAGGEGSHGVTPPAPAVSGAEEEEAVGAAGAEKAEDKSEDGGNAPAV
ncbi:CTP synthase 1-A-like isoform X2 [Pollicipes pollicipes]|nr:CTP synthase 1-A-like isoform X2 [Pollicipes pollicipes]XP_037090025.1 CTP synthase 1-A-like isoform X2 [Pollicipes pollicipes]